MSSGKRFLVAAFVALMVLLTVTSLVYGTGSSRSSQNVSSGSVVSLGYRPARTNEFYRAGLSVADTPSGPSTLITSIAQVNTISCGGWASVAVGGVHSNASATVVIHCYRFSYDGTTLRAKSMSTATLTAHATFTNGGASDFLSTNTVGFDTEGADIVKILIEAPSAGSVSLNVEIY